MCGIVAAFGANAKEKALEQYKEQANRGSEGFGFIAIKDGKIVKHSRTITFEGIATRLKKLGDVDALLFHHRLPTSTENLPAANHPIPLKHKEWEHNYYMLHNGVMSVASEYYAIRDAGYTFTTEVREIKYYFAGGKEYATYGTPEVNDSEILGYYVAEMLEGRRQDIPLFGALACIVVQEDKKSGQCAVYALRNDGNPLKHTREKGSLVIASEVKGAVLESETLHRIEGLEVKDLGYIHCGKSYQYQYTPGWGFSEDKEDKAAKQVSEHDRKAKIETLERELVTLRSEAEDWRDELIGCNDNERDIIRSEIKIADKKIERLEDELSELEYAEYGTKNATEGSLALLGYGD